MSIIIFRVFYFCKKIIWDDSRSEVPFISISEIWAALSVLFFCCALIFVMKMLDENTFTSVLKLDENDRIEEIAKMISGDTVTNEARNLSSKLLRN